MSDNEIVLLKLRWAGYSTQQIHQLLNLYPDYLSFSFRDQVDTLRTWENLYTKKELVDRFIKVNINEIIDHLSSHHMKFISSFNASYSPLLKQIYDYPLILFYKGNINLLSSTNTLGVVGSRVATQYSSHAMQYLFSNFTHIPLTIVSGLAKGADSLAHHYALKFNLPTIAVLGHGHLKHYPKETEKLRYIIEEKGLVISEYPPFVNITRYHFPQRNRLISGLSKGVLITEAGIKSGSQITIDCAIEQNRNVYVLPGSMFNPLTKGNLLRAQEGAMIVSEAQDILNDY